MRQFAAAGRSTAVWVRKPLAWVRLARAAYATRWTIPAPNVKPPPKAHRPSREPGSKPGNSSERHNGMLVDEVFP